MTLKSRLYVSVAAIAIAGFLAAAPARVSAQTAVALDNDDIGGVVMGANGPEAGVWVIAETTRSSDAVRPRWWSPTTRAATWCPICPRPNTRYGCAATASSISPKVDGEPGKQLDLRAVPAPNEAAAAQYYPAIYWYSMLKIPGSQRSSAARATFPRASRSSEWLTAIKNRACIGCHQIGQLSTRTIPAAFGEFKSGEDAWMRRTQSGQAAELMMNPLAGQLGGAPYKYFGDWTDRVAKGELPHAKPQRPQGLERNIVVTTWDWGDEKHYLHDLIASDRRNPTVNAYGPLLRLDRNTPPTILPILDPKTNTATAFQAPVRDPNMPESLGPGHAAIEKPMQPSAYWGEEKIWDTRVNNHNSMIDKKAASGWPRRSAAADNPASARRAPTIPRPSCSRSRRTSARSACSIPRR